MTRSRIQESIGGFNLEEVRRRKLEEIEEAKKNNTPKTLEHKVEETRAKTDSTIITPQNIPATGVQTIVRDNYGVYTFTNVPCRDAPNGVIPEITMRPQREEFVPSNQTLEIINDALSRREFKRASVNLHSELFIPTAEILYQLMRRADHLSRNAPYHSTPQNFTKEVKERVFTEKTSGVLKRSLDWLVGRRILTATTILWKGRIMNYFDVEVTQEYTSQRKSWRDPLITLGSQKEYPVNPIKGTVPLLDAILGEDCENAYNIFNVHVPQQKHFVHYYISRAEPLYNCRPVILKIPPIRKREGIETRVTLGLDRRGRMVIDCTQPADTVKGYIVAVSTPGVTL